VTQTKATCSDCGTVDTEGKGKASGIFEQWRTAFLDESVLSSFRQPFFLIDEGPRSRRYGRTAALRLLVQPCDEGEDDDCFFVLFLVMEHQWNDIDRGKPKYSGKNLSQCHFVHHKSHMD
jgi:hypothetical protein